MKNQIQMAIAYIGTGLMVYFFLLPSYNGSGSNLFGRDIIGKKIEDQAKAEELSIKAKNLSDNGKELQKQFKDFKDEDRNKLSIAIPIGQDIARTINEINEVSDSSKVKVTGLTYDNNGEENNKGKLYAVMGVGVQFSGDYENFYSLLNKLETNLRFVNIKSLSISAREGIISGNVQTSVYYFNKINNNVVTEKEDLSSLDGAINSRVFKEIENIYALAQQLGGKIQPSPLLSELTDTTIAIDRQQITQKSNPFLNKF